MGISARKINTYSFFRLPAAWWCGVRLKYIDDQKAIVQVRFKWINQNPFKSMYWAVQGMAAELSTGALLINQIRKSDQKISMLVAKNRAEFTKKAVGRITFTCIDGLPIADAIRSAVATGEGQTFWMQSIGVNKEGVVVSTFEFEWTIKPKGRPFKE